MKIMEQIKLSKDKDTINVYALDDKLKDKISVLSSSLRTINNHSVDISSIQTTNRMRSRERVLPRAVAL